MTILGIQLGIILQMEPIQYLIWRLMKFHQGIDRWLWIHSEGEYRYWKSIILLFHSLGCPLEFNRIAVLGTVFFRTSNIYSFIEPAKWDGLHLADLCMPWFMFIMGVCIPFSIKSQLDHKRTKYHIFKKILKVIIFLCLRKNQLSILIVNSNISEIHNSLFIGDPVLSN